MTAQLQLRELPGRDDEFGLYAVNALFTHVGRYDDSNRLRVFKDPDNSKFSVQLEQGFKIWVEMPGVDWHRFGPDSSVPTAQTVPTTNSIEVKEDWYYLGFRLSMRIEGFFHQLNIFDPSKRLVDVAKWDTQTNTLHVNASTDATFRRLYSIYVFYKYLSQSPRADYY